MRRQWLRFFLKYLYLRLDISADILMSLTSLSSSKIKNNLRDTLLRTKFHLFIKSRGLEKFARLVALHNTRVVRSRIRSPIHHAWDESWRSSREK